jgi:16S rRNA (guanine527-N7)-methyltransferase
VLDNVINTLQLDNVKAKHLHSNEMNQKFDFIVSRAVTAFPLFIKLAKGKIKLEQINSLPNGIIYLKGGDLTEEISDFKKKVQLYSISDFFSEDFFKTKFVVYYAY